MSDTNGAATAEPVAQPEAPVNFEVKFEQIIGALLLRLKPENNEILMTQDEIAAVDVSHFRFEDQGDKTVIIGLQEEADFLEAKGLRFMAKANSLRPKTQDATPAKKRR